jgi:excisionase family DNA binding protein
MAKSVSIESRYFDKRAAAEYLNCTPRYLEFAVKSGRLKAFKSTYGFVRFRLAELDAFMESGTQVISRREEGPQ